MKNPDYSAFSNPITEAEVVAYKQSIGDKWMVTSMRYAWISFLLAAAFLGTLVANYTLQIEGSFNGFLVVASFVGIVIGAIFAALAYSAKARARLAKFASTNGATYVHGRYNPVLSGMIFDEGHSRVLRDCVTFPGGVQIGQYRFVTGSGKNQRTHNWSFVSMKLPRRLPNMVLDSKQNNFLGLMTNLPDSFNKDQQLSLEGDFDDYFTLYAPAEYKTDALYIFTPDVMQAIIAHGGGYDMEIVDDTLYLYSSIGNVFSSPITIQSMLYIIQRVGTEIVEQGDYYADDRVGNRAMNIVAAPGQRLKSGIGIFGIIAIVAYILYIISHIFFLRL